MAVIRFGILGCSSIARRRFLPALARSAEASLEHVGSRDPAKAELWAREHSSASPRHGSYESVLKDPQVDAVYISTPPWLHTGLVMSALSSGKHVLCEKPAFPDLQTAVQAVELARKHRVRLMEAYSFKYHPQHARARTVIDSGRLGELRFFQAQFTYPRPAAGDIRLDLQLGGGVFFDSAGYPVAATLLQARSNPVSVYCHSGIDSETGVDRDCALTLRFAGSEAAQAFVGFGIQYRSFFTVSGSEGRLELERAFSVPPGMPATMRLTIGDAEETSIVAAADAFELMIDDFARQIATSSGESGDSERDLLRQHAIMDAANISRREARAIEVRQDYV